MIKTKELNQIDPKKLIPKEHQLKPGKTATFKLVGLRRDYEDPSKPVIPNITGVPVRDRIVTEEGTKWIAPVKGLDGDDKPVYHEIVFTRAGAGRIFLNGSSPEDQDIFEYMYLSNFNEANEKRDKTKPAIFTFVDKKAEATKRMEKMSDTVKAMQTLSNTSKEAVKEIAASKGWIEEDYEVVEAKVYEFAMNNATEFLALSKSPSREVESTVQRALNRNKIQFIARDKKFQYVSNKETILIVPQKSKKDAVGFLVNWLMKDATGRTAYEYIKTLLETEAIEIE